MKKVVIVIIHSYVCSPHIVLTVLFACHLVDGEIFHYLCAVIFLLHYMAMPMLMMECGWEFIAEFVCLANIELYRA